RLIWKRCVLVALTLSAPLSIAFGDQPQKSTNATTQLRVAVYGFLPEATTAVENLKEKFEKDHPAIDIDFELWDPYSDKADERGLEEIDRFDVIEVDACRLPELAAGKFGTGGGLDPLPAGIAEAPDKYVLPAAAVMKGANGN